MRWHPRGYGGYRRDPEQVKRDGWQEQGLLEPARPGQRIRSWRLRKPWQQWVLGQPQQRE